MIISKIKFLSEKSIILASSSPRRQEILKILGIEYKPTASLFEENLNPEDYDSPSEYVKATARGKAEEVMLRSSNNGDCIDLVIGADTCVILNGEIFGKPKNRDNAIAMLSKLSGRLHEVVTGVCLKYKILSASKEPTWRTLEFYDTTSVKFASLPFQEVEAYVDTGEPLDKAGGYGIQGIGGTLIEYIHGDYYNVMGFPLHKFCCKLLPIISEWKSTSNCKFEDN